jgi:hypothetical protein
MRSGAETIGNFSLEYIVKKQQLYDVTEIVPTKVAANLEYLLDA